MPQRLTSLSLLLLLLPASSEAGRRNKTGVEGVATPAASASAIPALAELLEKTEWTPTPELSGIFTAGAIFTETEAEGHQVALADCFDLAPIESTYTQAELVTQLQAGVSVQTGMGSVSGGVGLVKKVKFGTPVHYALPSLEMTPTATCEARLREAVARGFDLSTMYVIKEVLYAQIAEQTCGRVDAEGRFVGLGSAEVELAMACAQQSLEPVAVAYRTVPVTSLVEAPRYVEVSPNVAPTRSELDIKSAVRSGAKAAFSRSTASNLRTVLGSPFREYDTWYTGGDFIPGPQILTHKYRPYDCDNGYEDCQLLTSPNEYRPIFLITAEEQLGKVYHLKIYNRSGLLSAEDIRALEDIGLPISLLGIDRASLEEQLGESNKRKVGSEGTETLYWRLGPTRWFRVHLDAEDRCMGFTYDRIGWP
jgi:hypothetical protein